MSFIEDGSDVPDLEFNMHLYSSQVNNLTTNEIAFTVYKKVNDICNIRKLAVSFYPLSSDKVFYQSETEKK